MLKKLMKLQEPDIIRKVKVPERCPKCEHWGEPEGTNGTGDLVIITRSCVECDITWDIVYEYKHITYSPFD